MRFLVDAQLPPALAAFLIRRGHAAEHVAEVGLRNADDAPIWEHARSCGACLVTKDEDFAMRVLFDSTGPSVLWLRVRNCSNRALLQWFAPLLQAAVERLVQGEKLVEMA